MALFTTIPLGFFHANEIINTLPTTLLTKIAVDILDLHNQQIQSLPTKQYQQSSDLPVPLVSSVVNALQFIFRHLINQQQQSGLTAEQLTDLLKKETDLSPAVVSLLINNWINTDNKATKPYLTLPKLISLAWKLGVTVNASSSAGSNPANDTGVADSTTNPTVPSLPSSPAAPFVTLQLVVGDRDEVRTETLEMSLGQLQEFSNAIHQIQQQLETI